MKINNRARQPFNTNTSHTVQQGNFISQMSEVQFLHDPPSEVERCCCILSFTLTYSHDRHNLSTVLGHCIGAKYISCQFISYFTIKSMHSVVFVIGYTILCNKSKFV